MAPEGDASAATTSHWTDATAVITGAGRGLGAGMARAAASFGMSVVVADIDAALAQSMADELTGTGGQAIAVPTDVTDPDAVDRLADAAFAAFDRVGLVVNNAGIEQVGLIWEAPSSAWHRLMDVNLHGTYHGIHSFVPRLIAAGGPATILNVSSIGGFTSGAYQGMYQVSKRAVLALSECLISDLETIGSPIQVSVAFPSAVNTRIFVDADVPSRAGPETDEVRTSLADYLANDGMDADEAGAMLLQQAGEGRRWLSTDLAAANVFATIQRDALSRIAASFAD